MQIRIYLPSGSIVVYMKKSNTVVEYACDTFCRFCVVRGKDSSGNKSTGELKVELKEAKAKYTGIVFTGGELTIRRDFFLI